MLLGLLLMWLVGAQAFAAELSSDNSLSSLGLENGTMNEEFGPSSWESTVYVAPGTTELILNPVCSNAAAQIVSVTGTTLENGQGTVLITVEAENGSQFTYTVHVETDETLAPAETEAPETEAPTEAPTEAQTEPPTEAQTEPQTEDSTITFLNSQIDQFRERLDFSMRVIYGLIALAVVLMFLTINLLLKNRDLKADLRDAEDNLDFQTNEFARKEKIMDTDNYYAPVQQQKAAEPEKLSKKEKRAKVKEERRAAREQSEEGDSSKDASKKETDKEEPRQKTPEKKEPQPEKEPEAEPVKAEEPEEPKDAAAPGESAKDGQDEQDDVDVTMVEL